MEEYRFDEAANDIAEWLEGARQDLGYDWQYAMYENPKLAEHIKELEKTEYLPDMVKREIATDFLADDPDVLCDLLGAQIYDRARELDETTQYPITAMVRIATKIGERGGSIKEACAMLIERWSGIEIKKEKK